VVTNFTNIQNLNRMIGQQIKMFSTSQSIVVVDDEEELGSLFRTYIENMGYNVMAFTDPLMAYKYLSENPNTFKLILTDFRMPGMSGIELANKIREFDTTTKIILITAFEISSVLDSSRYETSKINHVLHKPIKLSLLKRLIEENILSSNSIQSNNR